MIQRTGGFRGFSTLPFRTRQLSHAAGIWCLFLRGGRSAGEAELDDCRGNMGGNVGRGRCTLLLSTDIRRSTIWDRSGPDSEVV